MLTSRFRLGPPRSLYLSGFNTSISPFVLHACTRLREHGVKLLLMQLSPPDVPESLGTEAHLLTLVMTANKAKT
jgi:hypothetical protein